MGRAGDWPAPERANVLYSERTYVLHPKRLICLVSAAMFASMATGITANAFATLNGAGSTLVAPLMNEWERP